MTPLVLFGKHPSREDFITAAASPAMSQFDQWLLQAMEWANAWAAPGWSEAFSRGSARAFVYHPPNHAGSLVVGALQPSRDRSGRQFPLIAAAELDGGTLHGGSLQALPVLLEPLWQQAAEVLVHATTNTLPLELSPLESLQPVDEALIPYREWTRSLIAAELWSSLLGSHPGDAPGRALQLLFECVRPFRAVEHPTTWLTLRLPLGSAAGAGICFWLDLVRRAAQWRSTIPSFFWCQDDQRAGLLLHLGQVPKSALAQLWFPTPDRDEICDLSSSSVLSSAPPDPAFPTIAKRYLADGTATVEELLELASALVAGAR